MTFTLIRETKTRELKASYEIDVDNKYDVIYRYTTSDGVLQGNVDAQATKQGEPEYGEGSSRQVLSMSSNNGTQFSSNSWEIANDVLGDLSGKVKRDIIVIFDSPETVGVIV